MNAGKGRGNKSLRAVLYKRVSSEEQIAGYSLDAQERAYRQYVESHAYESTAEYADEGRSARTDKINRRPQFAQMLEDARAGKFDIIVVH
jgi:site-specific DNA recombinase